MGVEENNDIGEYYRSCEFGIVAPVGNHLSEAYFTVPVMPVVKPTVAGEKG